MHVMPCRVALYLVVLCQFTSCCVISWHVIFVSSVLMIKTRHTHTKAGKKIMSGKEVVVKAHPAKTRQNNTTGRLTRVSNARSTSLCTADVFDIDSDLATWI